METVQRVHRTLTKKLKELNISSTQVCTSSNYVSLYYWYYSTTANNGVLWPKTITCLWTKTLKDTKCHSWHYCTRHQRTLSKIRYYSHRCDEITTVWYQRSREWQVATAKVTVRSPSNFPAPKHHSHNQKHNSTVIKMIRQKSHDGPGQLPYSGKENWVLTISSTYLLICLLLLQPSYTSGTNIRPFSLSNFHLSNTS